LLCLRRADLPKRRTVCRSRPTSCDAFESETRSARILDTTLVTRAQRSCSFSGRAKNCFAVRGFTTRLPFCRAPSLGCLFLGLILRFIRPSHDASHYTGKSMGHHLCRHLCKTMYFIGLRVIL